MKRKVNCRAVLKLNLDKRNYFDKRKGLLKLDRVNANFFNYVIHVDAV